MRVLVYHNPGAGHAPHPPEVLIAELQRAGHEVEWRDATSTKIPENARDLYDVVVSAGGDGNVGRTGRQLVGSGLPIAVIPLGTANNLSRMLRSDRDDLVERLDAFVAEPFDVGTFAHAGRDRLFLEGVGLGVFADTAARLTNQGSLSPPFGREEELARDVAGLKRAARTYAGIEVRLDVDGTQVAGRYLMVEVLNTGTIGPRLRLVPDGRYDDGALDVVLVGMEEREALVRFLEGSANGSAPFEVRRARAVTFTAPAGTTIHVDGNSVETGDGPVVLGIQPGGLRFLTGRSRD